VRIYLRAVLLNLFVLRFRFLGPATATQAA
jgi:hypothetical protein